MAKDDFYLQRGRVQLYTGNGKGKTTAALGLALRAVGHGLRVYVMQFLKGQTVYGELETARRLAPELTIEQVGREAFVSPTRPAEEDLRLAREAFARARVLVTSGDYDLVILDELNCAVLFGMIPLSEVLALIAARPPRVELVLTGRGAPQELMDAADLVTEMREIKHYYHAGQEARQGIES